MMVVECVAIIALIAILIFMTARSGRREMALSMLPLLIVPGFYLLSAPLSKMIDPLLPFIPRFAIAVGITVIGLVIACVLFGMLCGNYPTKRARRGYLWMCAGFSTLLTVVLLYNVIVVFI